MTKLKIALTTLFLFLPSLAFAVPVIQFAQTSGSNTITATPNAGDTATTISGTNVAINITQDIGGFLGSALLTLTATSTDSAVPFGSGATQHYAGTFSILSGAFNVLSGTFTDAALGVGSGLGLVISAPPDVFTLTSDQSGVPALTTPSALAFSFTNVIPPISIIGSTIAGFTATVSGNASATPVSVPEPTSLAVLGLGMIGLGFLKFRKA